MRRITPCDTPMHGAWHDQRRIHEPDRKVRNWGKERKRRITFFSFPQYLFLRSEYHMIRFYDDVVNSYYITVETEQAYLRKPRRPTNST
jgi:hypothetical protein